MIEVPDWLVVIFNFLQEIACGVPGWLVAILFIAVAIRRYVQR